MDFADILFHTVTDLPVKRSSDKPFRKHLKELLETFAEMVEDSSDFSKLKQLGGSTTEFSKSDFRLLINGIYKTIDRYYEGNPASAYQTLDETLNFSKVGEMLWKDGILALNTDLFRIRRKSGNYPLEKCDLFHIPFEHRGRVRTQRYSIPGLPSLYLSNSIYVAWEELLRPDINEIQAIRLQNRKKLRFLDLSTDDYNHRSLEGVLEYKPKEIIRKIFTWPIIAACSIKVAEPDASFKPEYIIPQLLLQWITKMDLDGIKYSSTHIQAAQRRHTGVFYNLVLPVKSLELEQGYCPILASLFSCTQVLPMQLRQFATTTGSFVGQETISANVNKDIFSLELIAGKEESYRNTSFGGLEHSLKGLNLEPIIDESKSSTIQKGVVKIPKLINK
jgi:hypothetical protein